MIDVNVTNTATGQSVQVRVNYDTLNARAARAAREIAFGLGAHVTVTDGETTYRVTKRARKMS